MIPLSLIYALATLTGLFCNSEQFQLGIDYLNIIDFSVKAIVLPISSFLILIGMNVLNDLIDATWIRIMERKDQFRLDL